MRRDRVTFAMMIGLPLMQLFLFGFAINADPHHLPTLVEMGDNGPLSRAVHRRHAAIGLFRLSRARSRGPRRARRRCGAARPISSWSFRRISSATWSAAAQPEMLIAADASDPSAVGGAAAALSGIVSTAVERDADRTARGERRRRARRSRSSVHREYNPEGKTSTNIVPGLLAIILSMTMVDDHRGRHRQGNRARHDGDADRDPGAAARGDAGQDPALCLRRLRADAGVPARGQAGVRRAVRGQLVRVLSRLQSLHRGQSGARLPDLDGGAQPDAGDAAQLLHHPALDPALGLHVPVRRHAGLGAGARHRSCRRRISCASSAR